MIQAYGEGTTRKGAPKLRLLDKGWKHLSPKPCWTDRCATPRVGTPTAGVIRANARNVAVGGSTSNRGIPL